MTDELTHLASLCALPESPELAVFEQVENPHIVSLYIVFFTCPEYSALCPFIGKADSAIWSSTIGLIDIFWRVSRSSCILFRYVITEHRENFAPSV